MGILKTVLIVIALVFLAVFVIAVVNSAYKHLIVPDNQTPVISLDNTVINTTIGTPIMVNGTITDDGTITSAMVTGSRTQF